MMRNENLDQITSVSLNELVVNQAFLYAYSIPKNYLNVLENININGIIQPLVINQNKMILSGYLRYQIARELNIQEVPVIIKKMNKEDEIIYFISSNYQREKSLLDGYKELQLIESMFELKSGMRSDLNESVKQMKIDRDDMRKGFTTYQINTYKKIIKKSKLLYKEKYNEVIIEKLNEADKNNYSLNSVLDEFIRESKLKEKSISVLDLNNDEKIISKQPKIISIDNYPLKSKVFDEINNLLNKLPEACKLEIINDLYTNSGLAA